MAAWLATQGHVVNRKRVRRLMRLMGLVRLFPLRRDRLPGRAALFDSTRGGRGHSHSHGFGHSEEHRHHDHQNQVHGPELQQIATGDGVLELSIFEAGVPPRFRPAGDVQPPFWARSGPSLPRRHAVTEANAV
jgi:hypothetical protein